MLVGTSDEEEGREKKNTLVVLLTGLICLFFESVKVLVDFVFSKDMGGSNWVIQNTEYIKLYSSY